MLAHLWTQEPAPLEYIELQMCRDVYHCPPQYLPSWHVIRQHMAMIQVENEVREKRQKAKRNG